MNKFYHGTTERNARAIEGEGFFGSDPSDFTDGFSHVENGVIFLATTPEHAQGYGEIVFVIETEEAFYFSCSGIRANIRELSYMLPSHTPTISGCVKVIRLSQHSAVQPL